MERRIYKRLSRYKDYDGLDMHVEAKTFLRAIIVYIKYRYHLKDQEWFNEKWHSRQNKLESRVMIVKTKE